MTVTIPSSGYMSSNTRIKGELKTSFEQLRDAIEVIDVSTDTNTSDITTIGALVAINTNNISTHTSDSNIHVTLSEKAKLLYGPIYIATQADFDGIFNGNVISNAYIFLSDNTPGYVLNSNVPFGSNVIIDSDPGVVIGRNGQYRFSSTGTIGTPINNVKFTNNWTFDGQGGINPIYGGIITYTGNGGFCELNYITNSIFECFVTNCKITGNGGAYYASATVDRANIVIKNVFKNEAAGAGGGVYGIGYSDISNITFNTATVTSTTSGGGGVSNCNYSKIQTVLYNDATNGSGGGVASCVYSTISNIGNNTSNDYGGGVYGCDTSNITNIYTNSTTRGGGVSLCLYSTISKVHDNYATGDGGGVSQSNFSKISDIHGNYGYNGAGIDTCEYCTISDVYYNTANDYGGGVYNSANSTISTIHHNTTGYNGGGVYMCDYSTITNIHDNNTTQEGNIGYGGGGVYDSNYCIISNIYNNTTGDLSSTSYTSGGGVMKCNYSTISNVYSNTCGEFGGGLNDCNSCTISNIMNNVTTTTAASSGVGGAFNCDFGVFIGNFSGNGGGATYNTIFSANDCIANVYQGTGTVAGVDYIISTTRATIDW